MPTKESMHDSKECKLVLKRRVIYTKRVGQKYSLLQKSNKKSDYVNLLTFSDSYGTTTYPYRMIEYLDSVNLHLIIHKLKSVIANSDFDFLHILS